MLYHLQDNVTLTYRDRKTAMLTQLQENVTLTYREKRR